MDVDVQGTGEQSIDPCRIEHCTGRHREECRITCILVERNQYRAVRAGEVVMNMGRRCGKAGDRHVTLHNTASQVDHQGSLRRRLRIRRWHLLLAIRRDGKLQHVTHCYGNRARLADVARSVHGLSSQHVIAFRLTRGVPVEAVRRRRIVAQ